MTQAEFIWTDRTLHALDTGGDCLVTRVTKKLQLLFLLRRPLASDPICLPDPGTMIWGFVPWPNIFRVPVERENR